MTMKFFPMLALLATLAISIHAGEADGALFKNDFEKDDEGKDASKMDVLVIGDGEFKVVKDGANKVLQLAEAPLETFGLLFGPTELENVEVQLRTFGTSTGRRFPVSAVGVNGVGGFLLRLNPAKKSIELLKADEVKKSAPYAWVSGTWTTLRIAIKKSGAAWVIQGKAWEHGKPEPAEWTVSFEDSEKPTAGRATLWGIPYSTTPIKFDDLQVSKTK